MLVIERLGFGGRNGLIRSWTPWLECPVESPQPRPSFGGEDLSTVCMMEKLDQGTYTRTRLLELFPGRLFGRHQWQCLDHHSDLECERTRGASGQVRSSN